MFHETVDLLTVWMLLHIAYVGAKNFLPDYETILDISNINYKDELLKAKNAVVLVCNLTQDKNFEDDSFSDESELS